MKFFETDEERFEFLKWMSVSFRLSTIPRAAIIKHDGTTPRDITPVRIGRSPLLWTRHELVIQEQPNIDRHVKRMADDPFLTIKDFYMQHGTFLNVYDDSVEETDEIKTIKDKRKLPQF